MFILGVCCYLFCNQKIITEVCYDGQKDVKFIETRGLSETALNACYDVTRGFEGSFKN